jgi:hypothetical protein
MLTALVVTGASANDRVLLPVEIAGEAGTVVSVTTRVPAGSGRRVRSLWMQIHGLAYGGMASVRINQGQWWPLNNETVTVAEPARSYGGIGGGFATLKVTLRLPEGSVADDSNTIEFRFNFTDGIVSGFRVLAFNFLAADGRTILPADTFVEDDPSTWTPPLRDPEDISAGHSLWERAQLTANALPGAPLIHAHCADCHAQDGADLKYFNFSNLSIVAKSRFHGLSESQGRQIASYIRSLPAPNPGRPWNPPYQPGPGLDDQPAANRAAGAGLAWALDDDVDALPFVFAKKDITPAAFRPDADLNPREIPMALQLPDWNHWLPRVHPLDFPGTNFSHSAFFKLYRTADYPALIAAGDMPGFFDRWYKSRSLFLPPHPAAGSNRSSGSNQWTAELAEAFYSAQLWQLVKTWEIIRKFAPRFRMNAIPAATAPAEVGIPNGPSGMGRSALTNEYFNNAWYEVQILVNSGNHRHHGRLPVDWVYIIGHFLELQQLSGRPEPGRLLVAVIKAMQSSDPSIGPDNYAEGWRPDRNIDPRIVVSREWAPVFRTVPAGVKQAIVESLLSAWLDKTLEYPAAFYFARGQPARYRLPAHLLDISGGRVWEASPQFQAAGVGRAVIERLDAWGKAYSALAELFHY